MNKLITFMFGLILGMSIILGLDYIFKPKKMESGFQHLHFRHKQVPVKPITDGTTYHIDTLKVNK